MTTSLPISVFIRPYTDTDRESVLELFRMNTPAYFAAAEEADLMDYLDHHAADYFLLEQENAIAGCGGFNITAAGRTACISWDLFHPQQQGKGLGRQLLQFRIDRIRVAHGISHITVRTSQVAYRFYEKAGFRLLDTVTDYWAPGVDLYRMELRLPERTANP